MPYKTTFSRLKEDEREIRKNLIIESAMRLCTEKPFHDIGMRDIAKEAGVSAAAIYRYFPSRDDLFIEAFIQDIIVIQQRFEKWVEESKSSIIEFAIAIVDFLSENEATFQMMVYFMIRGAPNDELALRFGTVYSYFIEILEQMFEREGFKGKAQSISHAFFASLAGVVMTFRNYPGKSKQEVRIHMLRQAKIVAAVFRNGISKGLADEI
ncbi:MAG: TetR/AcrR family transcriptional regulator [Desulfobacterales bacterium]|nr:TetR/AcrR family transcriptional regulator [Desulfobacterales bacterium]